MPIYSYVAILYYDTMEAKIGLIEAASGLGTSFGPMIGIIFILFYKGGFLY